MVKIRLGSDFDSAVWLSLNSNPDHSNQNCRKNANKGFIKSLVKDFVTPQVLTGKRHIGQVLNRSGQRQNEADNKPNNTEDN